MSETCPRRHTQHAWNETLRRSIWTEGDGGELLVYRTYEAHPNRRYYYA